MPTNRHLLHDWFSQPLPANVTFGPRCWLYSSFAFLHCRSQRPYAVRIGHDTGVYNGTFFDLGPRGEVEVGNYCSLVGAIFATDGRVIIGDYTFIAHEVVLADRETAVPYVDAEVASRNCLSSTSIDVGENCWIGARAVLLAGARIGDGAIIGAGAVVDFEVPPFAVVAGNPSKVVGSAVKR